MGTGDGALTPDIATLASFLSVNAEDVIADGETSGTLNWSFDSGSEAFDYLAAGETQTLTYALMVKDSAGATAKQSEIAALPDGGFVVVWKSQINYGDTHLYARRFDAQGEPVKWSPEAEDAGDYLVSPMPVSSPGAYDQSSIVVLEGGRFAIAWTTLNPENSYPIGDRDSYVQVFEADGTPIGDPAMVNLHSAETQDDPDLAPLPDGGFIAIWKSTYFSTSGPDISAQRFDADGNPVSRDGSKPGYDEFTVSTTAASRNYEAMPTVDALPDGGFAVSWSNMQLGIVTQRFDASGEPVELGAHIIGSAADDAISIGATDEAVRVDLSSGNDELSLGDGGAAVHIVSKGGTKTVLGGDGDDRIEFDHGHYVADVHGGDGNDYIEGKFWQGLDGSYMSGDGGDDTLIGVYRSDTLDGGAGDDKLIGGEGTDTASYAEASGNVTVYLGGGTATETDQNGAVTGTDTLDSIENVIGSDYDDQIEGDDGSNVLAGGDGYDVLKGLFGDDILNGGVGDDYLDGGAGLDTAFLEGAFGEYEISYDDAAETLIFEHMDENGNVSETDTLKNVENVQFSDGQSYSVSVNHDTGEVNLTPDLAV